MPEAVRQAKIQPVRVESQKLAEGVWLIAGGTHNSVLVEFRNFLAVIEAPQNEDRSVAVIGEVRKLVPGKPIQVRREYSSPFRSLGRTPHVCRRGRDRRDSRGNRQFYEDVVFYPAGAYASGRPAQQVFPSVQPAATGGIRAGASEVRHQRWRANTGCLSVEDSAHAATMLMAYLPKERILANADLYSPPAQGSQPPANPTPSMVTLSQNIQRLKLDVAQHVPIHGQPGTMEEFLRLVGKPSN